MEDTVTKKEFREGIDEVLETINHFASATEERFQNLNSRMDRIDGRQGQMEIRLTGVQKEMRAYKLEIIDMVDRKVDQVRGDLTVLIRQQSPSR